MAVEIESSVQDTSAQAEITQVLDEFADVSAKPKGLPPRRTHDHKIPLKI